MARIAVQVVDKYGNVLPYQMPVVRFELDGDADFVGENPMALLGGQGACYIKSRRTTGKATICAVTDILPPADIEIVIGE
jgi:beta-galactosidase